MNNLNKNKDLKFNQIKKKIDSLVMLFSCLRNTTNLDEICLENLIS